MTTATASAPLQTELKPKDFSHLIGMEGFSEKLLTVHFQLYEAYVKNTNTLNKKWAEFRQKGDYTDPSFGTLKKQFGWEYNSVKLHELYFGNLGGQKDQPTSKAFEKLVSQYFSSFDKWKEDFSGVATTRGIGWVVLYHDPDTNQLQNCWIDEHNNGHLIHSEPIVVLDVFEHAYLPDYGVDRKKYMAAFFKNLNWETIESRLNK